MMRVGLYSLLTIVETGCSVVVVRVLTVRRMIEVVIAARRKEKPVSRDSVEKVRCRITHRWRVEQP